MCHAGCVFSYKLFLVYWSCNSTSHPSRNLTTMSCCILLHHFLLICVAKTCFFIVEWQGAAASYCTQTSTYSSGVGDSQTFKTSQSQRQNWAENLNDRHRISIFLWSSLVQQVVIKMMWLFRKGDVFERNDACFAFKQWWCFSLVSVYRVRFHQETTQKESF